MSNTDKPVNVTDGHRSMCNISQIGTCLQVRVMTGHHSFYSEYVDHHSVKMSKLCLSDCGRSCSSHRKLLVEILTKDISTNNSSHGNDRIHLRIKLNTTIIL